MCGISHLWGVKRTGEDCARLSFVVILNRCLEVGKFTTCHGREMVVRSHFQQIVSFALKHPVVLVFKIAGSNNWFGHPLASGFCTEHPLAVCVVHTHACARFPTVHCGHKLIVVVLFQVMKLWLAFLFQEKPSPQEWDGTIAKTCHVRGNVFRSSMPNFRYRVQRSLRYRLRPFLGGLAKGQDNKPVGIDFGAILFTSHAMRVNS